MERLFKMEFESIEEEIKHGTLSFNDAVCIRDEIGELVSGISNYPANPEQIVQFVKDIAEMNTALTLYIDAYGYNDNFIVRAFRNMKWLFTAHRGDGLKAWLSYGETK